VGPLGHETIERIAALILVIGGGLFTVISLRIRSSSPGTVGSDVLPDAAGPRPRPGSGGVALTARTPSVGRSLVLVMAGLSGGAAFIHLVAAPPHFAEIGDLAAGFVLAAVFQAAWIRWCLAGPSRATMVVGIGGNLLLVAAWAWTRTVGLPGIAAEAGPEPIGFPDLASVGFEALIVIGLVVRWLGMGRSWSRRPIARELAAIAVVPAIGLVLVFTSLATIAIASGLDHGFDPAAMTEHVATH
jgi:hypothetical protein